MIRERLPQLYSYLEFTDNLLDQLAVLIGSSEKYSASETAEILVHGAGCYSR
jgi:hypothetical protein